MKRLAAEYSEKNKAHNVAIQAEEQRRSTREEKAIERVMKRMRFGTE